MGQDSSVLRFLMETKTADEFKALHERFEWVKRLLRRSGPWEGITWILDLLPDNPRKAVDALDAYFLAHIHFLPDGRMFGLEDAEAVNRQRYFHKDNPREVLFTLRPAEFEYLVAALYSKMGYEVSVTPVTSDGGIDCWLWTERRGD